MQEAAVMAVGADDADERFARLEQLFALGDRLAADGRGPFKIEEILAAKHEGHRY